MHRRQGARERRGVDRDTEIQPSPPLHGDVYGEQIPRVVDETIAYLECVSQPSLFFGEPSVREINDLIDAIRDAPTTPDLPTLSAHRPQLAAAALAAYVHSLPAPLVPSPAYERLCGALGADSYGARVAQVRDAIASLSEPNQAVLHRLFAFLAWLSKRSTAQGNDAARLADFWAPLLTPAAPYPKGRPQRTADYRITGLMLQQVACVFQGKPRTSLAQASHKPRTSQAQASHKPRTRLAQGSHKARTSTSLAQVSHKSLSSPPPPPTPPSPPPGNLDAYELEELPLPAELRIDPKLERRRARQWKRLKGSLLTDQRGQFKIRVKEDRGGFYIAELAPSAVSDDRQRFEQRDYLITINRKPVDELQASGVSRLPCPFLRPRHTRTSLAVEGEVVGSKVIFFLHHPFLPYVAHPFRPYLRM